MRKQMLAIVAMSPLLTGCLTVTAGPTPNSPLPPPPDYVTAVQNAAEQACSFVPTARTVLELVSAFQDVSAIERVSIIVERICDAVTGPRGARRFGARVRGVAVRGQFTR